MTYTSNYNYGYSPFANITTISSITISIPQDLNDFTILKYAFKGCTGIETVLLSKTDNWYFSATNSNSEGTIVTENLRNSSIAANFLKNSENYYLYWKNF
ncbi:MAG: hypothetical protein K5829_08705 [Treponema sp.]|nr:hypothetical protein [Treponema sp.]